MAKIMKDAGLVAGLVSAALLSAGAAQAAAAGNATAGKSVFARANGPTSFYTVINRLGRNLVNAFPGLPGRR